MRKLLLLSLFAAFTAPALAQSVTFSLVTPPCNYNGVLNAAITGLTPPYTVTWITSGTDGTAIVHNSVTSSTDVLLGYGGGPVTVIVSSPTGTATNSYAGASPFTYSLSTTAAACPALGTASVAVTGGTAPYTYQWYNKANNAFVATGSVISVPAGNYGVTITDAAGCKYGSRVNPDAGVVANNPAFTITTAATTAACTNGTASVASVSTGAIAPLSYAWSNGGNTATIGSLVSGTYTVTVTDAQGCHSDPATVFVGQAASIATGLTATAASCADNDGILNVAPFGGTAPYTYLWSNGSTMATQTGMPSGNYSVTITDANGCLGTGSVALGSSSPIVVSKSSTPSLCTAPSGNGILTISGGTAPYNVTWYTSPVQTTATAINLAPGTYQFRVKDATGCATGGSVTIVPVSAITALYTANSAACTSPSGSLSLSPTGGTPPYTYLWNTGASSSAITGVTAGNYTVKITDNLSCSITRTFTVPSATPVGVGVSVIPATCLFNNDGALGANPYGGTAPYTFGWSSGGVTSVIGALPSGPYFLNTTDAAGCTSRSYSYLPYDSTNTACFCTIGGLVFADTNGNCLQDAGEWPMPNVQVYCSGIGYAYTDANGMYSFHVPTGTYTVTETVPALCTLPACQTNNVTITAIAAVGCLNTVNFANQPAPAHDLRISTWNGNSAVAGSKYQQVTIITNEGSIQEDSVIAAYRTSGQFLAPWFVQPGVFTGIGNSFTSSYMSLSPGKSGVFHMTYNVPANISAGTTASFYDTVTFIAPLASYIADATPANNIGLHTTGISATAEANFKEVHPKGTGSQGLISTTDSVMEYMVHFQNTLGQDAHTVTVIDTLDNNLDWTSLHPVYTSHAAKISLVQSGIYKIATFTFENANLPGNTADDVRRSGMLTYTIKQNAGLAVGTQIRNRASIYFDYLAPVRTNSTLNTIASNGPDAVAALPGNSASAFLVYPNPAGKMFYAVVSEMKGDATLSVTDLTGKTIISKIVAEATGVQTVATDVSQLTPGIYFVSLSGNGTTQTQKLVVIR